MSYDLRITDDLAACHHLRRVVFINEQNVPEAEELDDKDSEAVHILATAPDGSPAGTARLLFDGETGKIGRVCVIADHRRTGLGAELIRFSLTYLKTRPGIKRAKLDSQKHAIGFYEKLGFIICGDEYLDAGIPHYDMDRAL